MKKLFSAVLIGGSLILGGCGIGGNLGSTQVEDFETTANAYTDEMAEMFTSIVDDEDMDTAEEHFNNAQDLYDELEPQDSDDEFTMDYINDLNSDGSLMLQYSSMVFDEEKSEFINDAKEAAYDVNDDIGYLNEELGL